MFFTIAQALKAREERTHKGHPMYYKPLPLIREQLRTYDMEEMQRLGWTEHASAVTILTKAGLLLAEGYYRIVFGDYGPYLEFSRRHLKAKLVYKFGAKPKRPVKYIWLYPAGDPSCKVYFQQATVSYADYLAGMLYISPYDVMHG
jgi:hypothetical protein